MRSYLYIKNPFLYIYNSNGLIKDIFLKESLGSRNNYQKINVIIIFELFYVIYIKYDDYT